MTQLSLRRFLTYGLIAAFLLLFLFLAWQQGFKSKTYIESEIDGKVQGVAPVLGKQGNSFQLYVITSDQKLVLIDIDNPAAYQRGQLLKLQVKTEPHTGHKFYAIKPE